jgi:molybdopterin converting factor small subunit
VVFTHHLKRFFPNLAEVDVTGSTVAEVIAAVDAVCPGLRDYVTDDHGALRPHVNVFVGDALIRDRRRLSDTVKETDVVSVFQALSGG